MRRLVSTVLLAALSVSSCHRTSADGEAPAGSASGAAETLPPLVLKDDTANALLTWVDDHGDFHVVEHPADVPEASREAVRVVLADRTDGTGNTIYVGDLRTKNGDGTYAVKTMSRAEWEELGASKRKSRLEALAPSVAPPPGLVPNGAPSADAPAPAGVVTATIYGASWCRPCHQAQELLERLGVKVTKKDIEESDEAQREMQAVLRKIHRSGGSIPVIDVMGQVFVGFSEGALRAAVDRARRGLN
ncbi:MAG TPA: glutaredoxin family protein [Polyangiaceae bacterium]|nr:glutaredoxin family protein [Polyangiaceae bacterium]